MHDVRGGEIMNLRELNAKIQPVQAYNISTALCEETLNLIQQARWHHDRVPFTKLPDGICTFHITYVTYYERTFIAHGVIWPYKQPEKAANFLFRVVGKSAQWNISDIKECCDSKFRQKRDVYRTKKAEYLGDIKYPYWTEPVRNARIDRRFTVKAHHYNGQLQLTFGTYKFQKEIDKLEKERL